MRLINRRFLRVSTIGIGAALAAVTLVSSAAATPAKSDRAAAKFVVHEASTLAIPHLDGIISNSVESMQQIFPTLARITGQGGLQPDMATSWKANDTGTQWTFTIR